MKSKKSKTFKKSHSRHSKQILFVIIGLILSPLTIYIGYRINSSDKTLIHLSVLPLLGGLIFEYKRISQKWSVVLMTALASFVFSFTAFLPGKREYDYDFDNHIQTWPFVFLGIFVIIAIGFHEKEITKKLTEGITLIQSLAFIYWMLDLDFWNIDYLIVKILIVIGLAFAVFSIFNALTNIVLSRTARLTLSIWSSIIMVLFAVDNVYRVYQNEDIETTKFLSTSLYIALQYFLLGISSIYMAQNIIMLFGFLPGRGTFFNRQYFQDLKELKSEHINRYSDEQVKIFDAFICLILTATIFGLNYHYNFVPRNFIIWATFVLFPFVLFLYYRLTRK